METPPPGSSVPRELPIVGGHLALDFANTVDDPLGPARHDHVSTCDDLVRWAIRVGTLSDTDGSRLLQASGRGDPGSAATLARAHELRVTLNELFGAVADGDGDISKHWTRLRPFVADAMRKATLRDTGSDAYQWSWSPVDELATVLHPIAAAAAELLVSDDLLRVKRCARCPWLFLDRSKNRSRRWCDMNDCGKAQKMERYVARRAAARKHNA